jgi:gliding motility-associated-like protein
LDFVVRKICLIISILFLLNQSFSAQITIAFQGGEIGDNWNFSSTGADNVAQSEATFSSNYTSGTSSIVVGGNTGGGSCFDGGTGNGNNVANTFTFTNVDISGSSNFNRTLTFQWGNRFPVCIGTGWDSNEDLIFTAYHNGIAQPSTTLATGSGNANFNIANNQFSWTIPTCVTDFYFTLSITTNRRDELLFVDDVNLQTPALNQPIPPTSLITGNTQICIGNTQNLSVVSVPNTTYTWSGLPPTAQFTTPNNSPTSNQISIDWSSTPAGTYTIQVIPSMNICGVSTDGNPTLIEITVVDNPTIVIQGATTICPGENAIISATGANTYLWDNGLGNGNQFTVSPTITTTYQVTGSIGNCVATNTVTITVTNSADIPITASAQSICVGESVTLSATGMNSYSWQNANGLSSSVNPTVIATPSATTTYNVSGTAGNCQANGSITIVVNALPIILAGNDVNLCEGDFVTLNATGGGNYMWTQNIQNDVAFQPQTSQIYTVNATGLNGCVGSDDILVTIVPKPIVQFQASTLTGCSPTQTQFSTNLPDIQSYFWNFGDGNSSQEPNPAHTYFNNGCNDVSLTVTSTSGCSASLMLIDYICSDLKPTANFEINPNNLSESNLLAQFVNLSENATTYSWNFGDLTNSSETTPQHQYNLSNPDGFWITLYAYSALGCVDSVTQLLPLVENVIYYVPNAFTPDGNEFNQTFQPVFTTGFDPTGYQMLIFNRWGEIVFESKDASVGWDGTNYQGLIVPDGTYSWKITFNLISNDDRKIILGHVNLTR